MKLWVQPKKSEEYFRSELEIISQTHLRISSGELSGRVNQDGMEKNSNVGSTIPWARVLS